MDRPARPKREGGMTHPLAPTHLPEGGWILRTMESPRLQDAPRWSLDGPVPCEGIRHVSRTERDKRLWIRGKLKKSFGQALCLPFTGSRGVLASGEAEINKHELPLLVKSHSCTRGLIAESLSSIKSEISMECHSWIE